MLLSLGMLGLVFEIKAGAFGVGGLVNAYDIPAPLSASYGDPGGGMLFVRLKVE